MSYGVIPYFLCAIVSSHINIFFLFRLTLPEASAYLKSLGIVNGINLDGGGSSAFVINQVLVNYPSNFW